MGEGGEIKMLLSCVKPASSTSVFRRERLTATWNVKTEQEILFQTHFSLLSFKFRSSLFPSGKLNQIKRAKERSPIRFYIRACQIMHNTFDPLMFSGLEEGRRQRREEEAV